MNAKGTFRYGNTAGQRYPINETTFDTIDTELKAYCLGFLYADGSVGRYGGDYSIRVGIHRDDVEILDLFRRCVETTKPWSIDGRGYALLALSNRRIYNALVALGVVQAKTFKITFPTPNQIPPHLLHHFVRGYFDGDGSVGGREDRIREVSFSFIGNMPFAKALRDHLVTRGFGRIKPIRIPSKVQSGKAVGSLRYGGGRNLERFYHYLYHDATVYLHRKHDRMEHLLALRAANNALPRHNHRHRIYLRSPDGQVREMRMDAVSLANAPICKRSVYALAKGRKQQIRGWTLDHLEPV